MTVSRIFPAIVLTKKLGEGEGEFLMLVVTATPVNSMFKFKLKFLLFCTVYRLLNLYRQYRRLVNDLRSGA